MKMSTKTVYVLLKSNCYGDYTYDLEVVSGQDALEQLIALNDSLEGGYLTSYVVVSQDKDIQKQTEDCISDYMNEAYDNRKKYE